LSVEKHERLAKKTGPLMAVLEKARACAKRSPLATAC
jgi:hypothetical protein